MASSATATTICQLSCFSSINHRLQIQRRSLASFPCSRSRIPIVMRLEGPGADIFRPESKQASVHSVDDSSVLSSSAEAALSGTNEPGTQPRTAKIHDFCLGIPFGGLVLTGGFLGFILSGNAKALGTGVLYGGSLLALSIFSLKIWRKGKSSLPFILGQAALSATLLWKNFQVYALTKKIVPAGLNIFIRYSKGCLSFNSIIFSWKLLNPLLFIPPVLQCFASTHMLSFLEEIHPQRS
ncbi:hypothetical protein SAY87_026904 [Trapa incisa]|uniref:Protein FATTY ACID EXPORT 1, chloroplastic n=1 Tax=Trapa incisa TaxID=236973 RepID=A0AAN7JM59_9MYRT|nr:hypothetical protein SAY87_026904 [Trapa incisa]